MFSTNAVPAPATATERAILKALAGGRQLRQYEIARKIGLTEHHDWGTHAALEAMVEAGSITYSHYHLITAKGEQSKKTYRFFRLAHPPCPMRKRNVILDWLRSAGLPA